MTRPEDEATQTFVGQQGSVPAPLDVVEPQPDLPVSVGGYEIVRKLGEGGMGVVYEATQRNPRRQVALKVLRYGRQLDPTHVRMFQREVDTLGRLKHRSIAAIYESGLTDDGRPFFAMELVRGRTLSTWLAERENDPTEAGEFRMLLAMFLGIGQAVAYAHQRGVIHRDIKPSNILVTEHAKSFSGSSSAPGLPEVKILDFGLARVTETDLAASSAMTEVGLIKGTLPYMSPEQIRGQPADIDVRTDVYSLGVLLYEMLARRSPYDLSSGGLPEAVRAICEDAPLALTKSTKSSGRWRKIDKDIVTIVSKALEKDPARRYQSVLALCDDIDRYLADQPIQARPPSGAYQLRKWILRHKLAFGASLALLLLTVVFAVTMSFMYLRAETATTRWRKASTEADAARQLAEEQRSRAELQAQRADEERLRADESRSEIERTSRELEGIIPRLRARVLELEQELVRRAETDAARPAPTRPFESTAEAPEFDVAQVGGFFVPLPAASAESRRRALPSPPPAPVRAAPPAQVADPDLFSGLDQLQGRIALYSGRYDEAETHLLRCRAELAPGPRREECLEHLVRLYEAWDKADEAEVYFRELEQLRGAR